MQDNENYLSEPKISFALSLLNCGMPVIGKYSLFLDLHRTQPYKYLVPVQNMNAVEDE